MIECKASNEIFTTSLLPKAWGAVCCKVGNSRARAGLWGCDICCRSGFVPFLGSSPQRCSPQTAGHNPEAQVSNPNSALEPNALNPKSKKLPVSFSPKLPKQGPRPCSRRSPPYPSPQSPPPRRRSDLRKHRQRDGDVQGYRV